MVALLSLYFVEFYYKFGIPTICLVAELLLWPPSLC